MYRCTIVPLYDCTFVALYHCTIVPLRPSNHYLRSRPPDNPMPSLIVPQGLHRPLHHHQESRIFHLVRLLPRGLCCLLSPQPGWHLKLVVERARCEDETGVWLLTTLLKGTTCLSIQTKPPRWNVPILSRPLYH